MKFGLIARCNDRGIGTITREVFAHLQPTKTLAVQPDSAKHMPQHHDEWYPGAPVVKLGAGGFRWTDDQIRDWLDGLDVVLMVETDYDDRMVAFADEQAVASVKWIMPEYFKPERPTTVAWNPTSYRMDALPLGARVVAVPVPVDRWPLETLDLDVGLPPRWLHVAGARAAMDRNGTLIVLQALRLLRREHHVIMRAQDEALHVPEVGRAVRLEQHCVGVRDYWDLYQGADALLLPRRYAGLSLPAQEAMGAGLGLVMPDVEPQCSEWPILPVNAPYLNHITTGAGDIPLCAPDPADLARLMDACADRPEILAERRRASRVWAERHSWDRLGPKIITELEHACSLVV